MLFFTADTHFGHKRMAAMRGFESSVDMDAHLICVWNEVVAPADTVFHLGDFSFHAKVKTQAIWKKLNGNKILVKGNHDTKNHFDSSCLRYYHTLRAQGLLFVLFHFPIEEWQNKHYGSVHLHGHSHGKSANKRNRIDVGVDTKPYFMPYSLTEIVNVLQKQSRSHLQEPRENTKELNTNSKT